MDIEVDTVIYIYMLLWFTVDTVDTVDTVELDNAGSISVLFLASGLQKEVSGEAVTALGW